jgi:hypothetical protein
MPFALLLFGILFVIVGFRDTQSDLLTLVKGDFSGPNNFIYWVLSLFVIGAVGYIPKFKPISDAFLVLVLLVLFLSNQGFFTQFLAQVKSRSG